MSQQSQPCHSRLWRHSAANREAALAQWKESSPGMQSICSKSMRSCEHKKDLNVPNTESREEKTPEETVCARLADTKVPLSSEMPIQLTVEWVYVHDSNKIISTLGPPAELLGTASTGFFLSLPIHHNHWPRRPTWWKNTSLSCLGKNRTCCIINYKLVKTDPSGLFQVCLYLALESCYEENQSKNLFTFATIAATKIIFISIFIYIYNYSPFLKGKASP